jgi:hypothetical protein
MNELSEEQIMLQNIIESQKEEINLLKLVNAKLGYSTRIMSDFHLTTEDKINIANSIDLARTAEEVKTVYDEYYKLLNNKALGDDSDFQMSQDFKDNTRYYFSVALGYDPISKLSEKIKIVSQYFTFENDIRNTPNASHRQAKTDALLKTRAGTLEALNDIIDTLNSFNSQAS